MLAEPQQKNGRDLGFQEAAWAVAGPGHQSPPLMFIFKAPNVRSGRLSPTKKANDFHASFFFFSTLIPLPRLLCLCCRCPQTGIQSLSEDTTHLGNVKAIWEGPAVLSRSVGGHFQASEPQGLSGALAAAPGE